MTDSQKLDLLLDKVGNMDENIQDLKSDVVELKSDVSNLYDITAKMQGEINGLKNGQHEIRKNLKKMADMLEDTYNVALDAWGQSCENRVLLTQ